MSQIYNDTKKRPKLKENQLEILGISARKFMHFAEDSAEELQSRREHCWGYKFIYENTPNKLLYLAAKSCYNFT